MPIQHANRKGKLYHLVEGTTRTGKPMYYFSTRPTPPLVDALPAGYEIYERPDSAQVFLRRARPRIITESEQQVLEDAIHEYADVPHFIVDVQDNSLVVYLPGVDETEMSGLAQQLRRRDLSPGLRERFGRRILRSTYVKTMRFLLQDRDTRKFTAERWCFLGSIDTWIYLGGPASLSVLVRQCVPQLGRESLYERP